MPTRAVPGTAGTIAVPSVTPVATVTAIAWRPVAAVEAVTALAVRFAAGQVLTGRLALEHLDRDKRQLAAVVYLADLHLDLVADVDHVVDVLDPPAAVQLADLGDVQQPVLARQQ